MAPFKRRGAETQSAQRGRITFVEFEWWSSGAAVVG